MNPILSGDDPSLDNMRSSSGDDVDDDDHVDDTVTNVDTDMAVTGKVSVQGRTKAQRHELLIERNVISITIIIYFFITLHNS